MATNVILPALGMAQDTGKIVEWLKAEGQHVTAGEPLVVIETDKAAVDLEAPATGILAQVSAKAGDEVPVAQVIAVILSADEAEAGVSQPDRAPAPAVSAVGASASGPSARPVAAPAVPSQPQGANVRRLASPKARRIAAERGVDLATLHGTGPGGVVLAADVPAAVHRAPAAAMTPPMAHLPPAASPSTVIDSGSEVSTIWRLMAERTTQSWTTIPHFFLMREVAAGALVAWRERIAQRASERVTYTDLLIRIVGEALRRHPRLNASWQDGAIVHHDEINIGLAVAVEDGLVVPVIHQAGDLTPGGIARRRAELVGRAQAGKLRPPDLQGGTFTISNLGMYGIDAFNAIINAPQAAILAIGRMVDRVVPVNGQPAVRPMLTLSLSCDHRVVDGARGAEFLATVAALIEEPLALPA
jgi:pyruvate dehydrogenase E2 component (dihydrolipoamide acetyltransferase)